MSYQRVHHNVENCGGQLVALRDPPLSLEQKTIVAPDLGHHVNSLAIVAKEVFHLWYWTVSGQDLHAFLEVERIVGLP